MDDSYMLMHDLIGRGISDKRVLAAFNKVPRELFVVEEDKPSAYADHPLPIGEGQTISQPYIVAYMTEQLELKSTDRVLEIGTGSGYQAAILAELSKEVYSIEFRKSLVAFAKHNLQKAGYSSVVVKEGDGYFGWKEHAPYDAIIITAAAAFISPHLKQQLKIGGRLIAPVGETHDSQTLEKITRLGKDRFKTENLVDVRFVPMVGQIQSEDK